MVYYEGHVTKDGDLVVNMSGSYVTLREFLQVTKVGARRDRNHGGGRERRRVRARSLAVAE